MTTPADKAPQAHATASGAHADSAPASAPGAHAGAALAHTCQSQFERRWGHLRDTRVRALAWLLDSPDLLDARDPAWQGKIAVLGEATPAVAAWLAALDTDPAALAEHLGERAYTRLGLYAEKLMAFYFSAQGQLVAHGLQVRAARNDTVGEFDFLLDAGPDGVEHIEFATKFYLLDSAATGQFDTFVGPNLADSLGAKMRKIVARQLVLGSHPAAQALLPRPVLRAHALVKGWLFYPAGEWPAMAGLGPRHCRGFWCARAALDTTDKRRYVLLPRLEWLAPWRGPHDHATLTAAALQTALADVMIPVLVAEVEESGDALVETARGFIVPDDWHARAAARRQALAS